MSAGMTILYILVHKALHIWPVIIVNQKLIGLSLSRVSGNRGVIVTIIPGV